MEKLGHLHIHRSPLLIILNTIYTLAIPRDSFYGGKRCKYGTNEGFNEWPNSFLYTLPGKMESGANINVNTVNKAKNRVCTVRASFKGNIWSELLYSPTQPEPSETSFLSFL